MERKIIMMLVAVVVVIGVCVYFMMNNELAQATFTNTHAQIFGSGEGGEPVPASATIATTDTSPGSAATPYLDPTRKIVSFGPNGDIDDSLTLGDIMQNAYYLAAKAYQAAKGDIDTAFSNAGISQTNQNQNLTNKMNNLITNVSRINTSMVGASGANSVNGLNPPYANDLINAAPLRNRFQSIYDVRYVRKGQEYAINVGPGNYNGGATNNYLYASGDNYRAAWNGTSNARWKFVDPLS